MNYQPKSGVQRALYRARAVPTRRLLLAVVLVSVPHKLAHTTLPAFGLTNTLNVAARPNVAPVAFGGLTPLVGEIERLEPTDTFVGDAPVLSGSTPAAGATVDASPLSFGALLHRASRDFLWVSADDLEIANIGARTGSGSSRASPFVGQGFINGLVDDGSARLGFTGRASGGGGGGGGSSSGPDNPNLFVQGGANAPLDASAQPDDQGAGLDDSLGDRLSLLDDPMTPDSGAPEKPALVPLPPGLLLLGSGLIGMWLRGRARGQTRG